MVKSKTAEQEKTRIFRQIKNFELLELKEYYSAEEPGEWFVKLPPRLQVDEDIVLAAVQKDYRVLRYVGSVFQDDLNLVISVVKQNGVMLAYASDRLRANKEVVLWAVDRDYKALQYAARSAITDPRILQQSLRNRVGLLSSVKAILKNRNSLTKAVKKMLMPSFINSAATVFPDLPPWRPVENVIAAVLAEDTHRVLSQSSKIPPEARPARSKQRL